MDTNEKLLRIYLNDHLAGAIAGTELARRAAASNEGNEFGAFLTGLAGEIEDDRASLETVMDKLGVPRDKMKQGAAWIAEKVGRLKLNGQITGYSPLSRLLELEGLAVGIEAKGALWRSLLSTVGDDQRVSREELERLLARAEQQREAVEKERLKAAETAFGPS